MHHKELPEKETRFLLGLFGKPAWEVDALEGGEVTAELLDEIESLGEELQKRLQWAAGVGRELLKHGWQGSGGLYDIDYYKLIPLQEAKKELKKIGLNPDEFDLQEEEIEDE